MNKILITIVALFLLTGFGERVKREAGVIPTNNKFIN